MIRPRRGEPNDAPVVLRNERNYFDRVDLIAILVLTVVAFVIRFFSPILPDFFAHPFGDAFLSNCVSSTPIDPQGDLGTLCGLAYPFNRGYPDPNGQLSPSNGQVFDEVYFPVDAYDDVKGIEQCKSTTVLCQYNYFDPEPPLAKEIVAAGEWGYGWYRAHFQGATGDYIGMLATGLMIATLPVLVLYLFLSEWFVKGMTAGAIKG